MTWEGKPRWNGKIHDVDLNKCFLPFIGTRPFLLQIENCEDYFLPVFTTVEELAAVMAKMNQPCTLKQVTDAGEFLDSVLESGVRVMLNPKIINAHHTKWLEVVKAGDVYKFEEASNG